MSEENVDKWTHYSNGEPVRAGDLCTQNGNPVVYLVVNEVSKRGFRLVCFSQKSDIPPGLGEPNNGSLCVTPEKNRNFYGRMRPISHIDFLTVFKNAGLLTT